MRKETKAQITSLEKILKGISDTDDEKKAEIRSKITLLDIKQ
jgi:ferritin-like metal-binding protein YciE